MEEKILKNQRHRNGYAILKERHKKMREIYLTSIAEKEATIEDQRERITNLEADLAVANNQLLQERAMNEKLVNELFEHMGWWRRWLWNLGHAR